MAIKILNMKTCLPSTLIVRRVKAQTKSTLQYIGLVMLGVLLTAYEMQAQVPEPDSTDGIYSGSGVVPNNTIASIANQFTLGAVTSIAEEQGTFLLLNKTSKRINLVSQGFVRLGDLNELANFPAWLIVNSESGVIQSYAKTDQLFRVDSFFYSLHRGGLQLPNNVYAPPAYFIEDRGMLYFNSQNNRLNYWDGTTHRQITTDDNATFAYQILTESGPIGMSSANIVYANPASGGMIISLPHAADFDTRAVTIKNINTSLSVSIQPTVSDFINGLTDPITLLPNQTIVLHAMSSGWQQL